MYWLLTALLPYVMVFLFLWSRRMTWKKEDDGAGKAENRGPAMLSLVIALKDEAANVKNLVNDLADQSLDQGLFEVIFVDDASSDATAEIIGSSSGLLHRSKILHTGGRGKKKAIAIGIEEAGGDYIVTTDGDCRADRDWLKDIYSRLSESNVDMLVGPVDIIDTGSLMNRMVQLEFLALQAVTEIFAKMGKPVLCNGANLCFKKPGAGRYEAMVKNKIPSGDDIFLMESFRKEGKIISWIDSPGSIILTHGPASLKELVKQRLRWTSKSPFYTEPLLLALASLVFLTSMFILAIFLASFFFPALWIIFILLLAMKSVPDFLLLYWTARKRAKAMLLSYFLPVQLLYPFYASLAATAGLLKGLFLLPRAR